MPRTEGSILRQPWHIREDADPVLLAMVTELLPALDAYAAKRPHWKKVKVVWLGEQEGQETEEEPTS